MTKSARRTTGQLTLAKDLLCWNVTDDGIKVREVVAQEAVWPAKSPFGTVPPEGDREELAAVAWSMASSKWKM